MILGAFQRSVSMLRNVVPGWQRSGALPALPKQGMSGPSDLFDRLTVTKIMGSISAPSPTTWNVRLPWTNGAPITTSIFDREHGNSPGEYLPLTSSLRRRL